MKYLIDNKNDKVLLKVSGDVKIQNINELKNVVLDLLNKGNELILDNGQVNEIDLTYYQFLISALNLAMRQNKRIQIINNSDCFRKLYEEIGITQSNKFENINKG